MTEILLNTPLRETDIRRLKIGDVVFLKGSLMTSRDMGHLKIRQLLDNKENLPVDFNGSVILHAGPVVNMNRQGGYDLVVIGPTTSIRMEPYHRMVADLGVKGIIGKGGLGEDSLKDFAEYGQVYFQAAPGCAVLLAEGISEIKEVHWLELGVPEALWILEAQRFGPLVVGMDSHGKSIYQELREKAERKKEALYGC